jgi:hypothetical protein
VHRNVTAVVIQLSMFVTDHSSALEPPSGYWSTAEHEREDRDAEGGSRF